MQDLIIVSKNELTEIILSVISPFFKPKETSELTEKPPVFLTRKEVAKILNITLPTLQKHTESGLLTAHYYGRRVLYEQHELTKSLGNAKAVIVKKKNGNS